MKKDMNQLIESFFSKKENVVNALMLENLIREQFNNIIGNKKTLTERKKQTTNTITAKYSYIPEISVSEIGWSAIETLDSGDTVSAPQRAQLEQYLSNIKGADLNEKINAVNQFYDKSIDQLVAEGFIPNDSKSARIQSILSYLVFLKTLTTIITNFNAASAGFSFESFLGVLLGGQQVPTGEGTIADMIVPSTNEYMSLKLYAETSVEVGGSFTDLINDLVNPSRGKIIYIVAMKNISGQGLERQGTVRVFKFHFDMNNVLDYLLVSSKHSKKCIELPKAFIATKTDFSGLKKTVKGESEIKTYFDSIVANEFKSDKEFFSSIKGDLENSLENEEFYTGSDKRLGFATPAVKKLENLVLSHVSKHKGYTLANDKKAKKDILDGLKQKIMKAFSDAKAFAKGTDTANEKLVADLKKQFDKTGGYATPEESVEFYSSLRSKKEKILALKNCRGYLEIEQFSISKTQLNRFDSLEELGTITVGREKIEKLINEMGSAINQEIFEIFDSLAQLTTNINSYFATGLRNDPAADAAQDAAKSIDKKTEKVQKQMKK